MLPPAPRLLSEPALLLLNRQLRPLREDGSLTCLEDGALHIAPDGLPWGISLTYRDGRLRPANGDEARQVCIKGSPRAFAQLILGHNDPDTLFFRRELQITGDTALGVALKNLLDSRAPAELLPAPLLRLLRR